MHSSQSLSLCLLLAEGILAMDLSFLLHEVVGDNCVKATGNEQVSGTRTLSKKKTNYTSYLLPILCRLFMVPREIRAS